MVSATLHGRLSSEPLDFRRVFLEFQIQLVNIVNNNTPWYLLYVALYHWSMNIVCVCVFILYVALYHWSLSKYQGVLLLRMFTSWIWNSRKTRLISLISWLMREREVNKLNKLINEKDTPYIIDQLIDVITHTHHFIHVTLCHLTLPYIIHQLILQRAQPLDFHRIFLEFQFPLVNILYNQLYM